MVRGRHNAGFTLIEVVLAAMLMMLIWAVFYSVTTATVARVNEEEEIIDAQQNVRLVMDRLSRELRQAKRVEAFGENWISFRDVNQRLIRYYLDGEGEIQRAVSGGGNNIVAYGIDRLHVFWDPERCSVYLTVYAQKHRFAARTTVNVRVENH